MGNGESSGKGDDQNVNSQSNHDFKCINGRWYHNEEACYIFPSDIEEIDRQQQQHYYFKHIFRTNISAPAEYKIHSISHQQRCGAGIWLLELATEYEKSEFFGVDMSPVFPAHIKPSNSNFIKANVLNGLPFPPNEFDYIHISFMHGSFKDDQWQNIVIPELIRVLKPGGWLEFYDVEIISINGGPLVMRLTKSVLQLIYIAGLNPKSPTLIKDWLSSYACLKDIKEIIRYPYIGKWKGEIIDEEIEIECEEEYDEGCGNDVVIEEECECENPEEVHLARVDVAKRKKDVEIGRLLNEMMKTYYTMDSENLSKCMGVEREEFLSIVEECFEHETSIYDTKMKVIRVICKKEED
ncbi:11621_t:CDS:2, partial [Acaulospora colombiana]